MDRPSSINVLFLASEADPFIKVGGLGDVAGSLPKALRKVSQSNSLSIPWVDARLVIPNHPGINKRLYPSHLVTSFTLHPKGQDIQVTISVMDVDGMPVYLVGGAPIDQERGVYSANLEDDGFKYIFFSMAALELARHLSWTPDILHANDWHTATAVYALAMSRSYDPFYRKTASLLTIHNLPYLGAMTGSALDAFGIPPALNTSLPTWAASMALPLGLLTADAIVAVSPGYSHEIMTSDFGSGLDGFLKARSNKITGILNGLDPQRWDPATDADLAVRFSQSSLSDRAANKAALQAELDLEADAHIPLLAMVTRMDPQKGVDLAEGALRILLQSSIVTNPPLQVVFLGTGNPVIEASIRRLEQDYPHQVKARILYNEKLSRHIYAGADMLLMPSRYEPCGLSQMIAMRYGCIPVAHATGGLTDTIQDSSSAGQGTGFLFKPASPQRLVEAIERACTVYLHSPTAWQSMQLHGMQQDFSWDRSALEYIHLYQKILAR